MSGVHGRHDGLEKSDGDEDGDVDASGNKDKDDDEQEEEEEEKKAEVTKEPEATTSLPQDIVAKTRAENADLMEMIEARESELEEVRLAASQKSARLKDAREQVVAGDEEFDMLSEALEEKSRESRARAATVVELQDTVDRMKAEEVRLKTIIRKRTTIASTTGTGNAATSRSAEDVCLSARSFAENDLIALRDEALAVKEEQLALVNKSNVALRENIDQLETEMQQMQVDAVAKDKMINTLRTAKEAAEAEIQELAHQVEVKKGREAAMEVSTQQNAQLLQLLQQQEAHSEKVQTQNEALEEEVRSLKEKARKLVSTNADLEANATTSAAEASRLRRELLTVRSSWEKEETLLRRKLRKLEMESAKTIAAQREELRIRREKHYEMLERVQTAEDKVRAAEDSVDEARREMADFEAERLELQARVVEIRRWADSREAQHHKVLTDAHASRDEARALAADLEKQRAALTLQLHEMSGTVLKAVDKQRGAIDEASQVKHALSGKELELEQMHKRMVKEGNLQGKRRMKAELEQRTLLDQLEQLRQENLALAEATNSNFEQQSKQTAALQRQCRNLEAQLAEATRAQEARLAGVLAYVEAALLVRRNNGHHLCLRGCRIGSSRYVDPQTARKAVTSVCKHLAGLLPRCQAANDASVTLDLADNALGDDAIVDGLGMLVQAPFIASTVTLNLCDNELTASGLRSLVLALQKNPRVQHVFVHRDGTIQGLRGADVVYTLEVAGNARPSEHMTHEKLPQL
ncbi:Hypothetical Protein FCC1311_080422 [Hondaea fermentalgiana]|uniref:Uncharacterized protein n=1 Tax=Hondaea fermentalgiana TaxID=2315210 RepID=A0A2R5GLR4_9STRA|nr:Hypothetical Protein FCC1311_080422 [Hondaea fermentalgiana]|eukprot:GBG31817.1 Hypothetical Protein FCC1311_080422 [Hondaea fermentalgiana]